MMRSALVQIGKMEAVQCVVRHWCLFGRIREPTAKNCQSSTKLRRQTKREFPDLLDFAHLLLHCLCMLLGKNLATMSDSLHV